MQHVHVPLERISVNEWWNLIYILEDKKLPILFKISFNNGRRDIQVVVNKYWIMDRLRYAMLAWLVTLGLSEIEYNLWVGERRPRLAGEWWLTNKDLAHRGYVKIAANMVECSRSRVHATLPTQPLAQVLTDWGAKNVGRLRKTRGNFFMDVKKTVFPPFWETTLYVCSGTESLLMHSVLSKLFIDVSFLLPGRAVWKSQSTSYFCGFISARRRRKSECLFVRNWLPASLPWYAFYCSQ